jgi:ABC-2 type transport system permease protein
VKLQAIHLYIIELKKLIKSPITFVIMVLVPALLLVLLSFGVQPLLSSKNVVEKFDVAMVNHDNSATSRSVIEQFEASEELKNIVQFIHVTHEEAMTLIETNKVAAAIIIPEGFSRSLKNGENKPLKVVGNYQRPLQSTLFKEMMMSALNLVTAAQSGVNTAYYFLEGEVSNSELKSTVKEAIVHFTFHSLSRNDVFKQEYLEAFPYFSIFQFYTSSGIIFILFVTSLFSLIIVANKESSLIDKRLITYGLRPLSWVFAKFLTVLTLLTFQAFVLFIFLYLFYDQFTIEDYFLSTVSILLTIIAICSFNVLLISLRKNPIFITTIGMVFFILISYVGGTILPSSLLPETVTMWSNFTLTKWAHTALLFSLFISDGIEVFISAMYLISFSILFLGLSLYITKLRMRQL